MSVSDMSPLVRWNVGACVDSVSVSHDGTRVASSSWDHLVRIWDLLAGSLVMEPLKGHTDWVRSVAWSHDDTRIVSCSWDETIRIWDARTGAPIGEPLSGHNSWVTSVAFSPDSTRIISSSYDNTIRIWNSHTGALMGGPLERHTSPVKSVAFSPDNTRIVSGSKDQTIGIWNAHTGAPMGAPLRGHSSVYSVAFSPNSARIASGSSDATICIWDARTGTSIGEPLRGHTSWVNSVAFSPASNLIVSGSNDETIRIWDAYTGASIGEPLRGHTASVQSVTFSLDGAYILSGSQDGTICVWEVPESMSCVNTPSFDMVNGNMSAQEMFECLVKHGCRDLSSSVDPTRYSASAIASGGFGDVWQAGMSNGTLVAVKCLRLHVILQGDLKGMKRTARELHNWSKAQHQNIQELLGIVMFQDRLGMVSLWMENGNLQQYIEKNPSIERYPLCVQVADGVAYLHGIGMIHGDLKAINVLVSADGIAKINDFDYSTLSESTLRFSETTRIGGGTIRWMAPELLLQDDDGPPVTRNATTDVYALGMTLLEIVSGKVPYYQYQYDVAVIRALDKKETPNRPQQLSGLDDRAARMWVLLLDCWQHDPFARPAASSVLKALQHLVV